jgi:hypothetical protein
MSGRKRNLRKWFVGGRESLSEAGAERPMSLPVMEQFSLEPLIQHPPDARHFAV